MKTNILEIGAPRLRLLGLMLATVFFVSACYTPQATRYITRTADGSVPWWCEANGSGAALAAQGCYDFSLAIDVAVAYAYKRWTYQDGLNAGGTPQADPTQLQFEAATTFNGFKANMIQYESTDPGARAISVGWRLTGQIVPPEGFSGQRDVWMVDGVNPDVYTLKLWVLRGFENHPDVFAATHPCEAALPLTSTTDACYVASHTEPLELLVTNDDGFDSEGIDVLVEALTDDPADPSDPLVAGLNVTVVAPLTQQSGQGGNTTPGGAPGASTGLTTLSGYPVLAAVDGTPADTVNWGLNNLVLSPGLILSGMNEGQNLAVIGDQFSGTIGAARAGRMGLVDAIASSQEAFGTLIPDFPAGAVATLALLEQWRIGEAGLPFMSLPNINIPSCSAGSIRGTVETVVGPSLDGRPYSPSDCTSTSGPGVDDLDAFLAGFISIADMGTTAPPGAP